MGALFALFAVAGMGLMLDLFSSGDSEPDQDEADAPDPDDIIEPVVQDSFTFENPHIRVDDSARTEGAEYILPDGQNFLDTGSGDDIVRVPKQGNNTITMGDGNDLFIAETGFNAVRGEAGEDTYVGGDGRDAFYDLQDPSLAFGGAGSDGFVLAGGSTITSGEGEDRISFRIDLETDDPLVITDFDATQDSFQRVWVSGVDEAASLSIVDWEDGMGADMLYGDSVIAHIHGGQGMELDLQPLDEPDNNPDQTSLIVEMTEPGRLNGNDQDNLIRVVTEGAVTINSGDGDDYLDNGLNFSDTSSVLNGGAGDDTIVSHGASDTGFRTADGGSASITTATIVDGGDGNDVLVMTDGHTATGGAGMDTFGISTQGMYGTVTQGTATQANHITTITDFTPGEDTIVVEMASSAVLSIVVWGNGQGADILSNGDVVAHVQGGQTLSVADIVIADSGLGVALLGHH